MRIHLLGIGGTGMGTLARLFVESGHIVTGTDGKLYPPMSDQVAEMGIQVFEGYKASNIDHARPQLVVIGNVIRRENKEAQEVMRRGIRYLSMPQALSDFFLKGRTPVVVAGTHGKTTCATLAAWVLKSAGERPGFFVGGVGLNLGTSCSRGRGPLFVVEGDEYDTAFFDKGPKFVHYRPSAVLLTSIEFDHADIYRDLNHVIESFRRLVNIIPPDGLLVVNADDENANALACEARCRVVRYGTGEHADHRISGVSHSAEGTSFSLSGIDARFEMRMWGSHNVSNAAGVVSLLSESGLAPAKLAEGLSSFKGVRRRQEVVAEVKTVTVVDDFAHHPTAVAKTIESMRMRFPGRRVWAIFEPRSNTSRRKFFQKDFAVALSKADRVIIASPFKQEAIDERERLDPGAVADAVMKAGVEAHHIPAAENIVEFVMRGVAAGDVLLVMSNGGFDGMHEKLAAALEKRKMVTDEEGVPWSRVPR